MDDLVAAEARRAALKAEEGNGSNALGLADDDADDGLVQSEDGFIDSDFTPAGPVQLQLSRRPRSTQLPLLRLSHLSRMSGLAGIDAKLGLQPEDSTRVAERVCLMARFDDGRTAHALRYATASFRESPWYATVLHRPSAAAQVSIGELRAIERLPTGDVAVRADMKAVEAEPRCRLAAVALRP